MASLSIRCLFCVFLVGALAGCGDQQAKALKRLAGNGYSLSVSEFVRAARAGDAQAVRWFVQAGVVPSLADAEGHTALGEAVAAGKLEVVDALVTLGVKLPRDGEPAAELLRAAVRAKSGEVLRFLLDHQVTAKGIASDAVSPLAVAAEVGHREAVELLLPVSAGREQEALFAAAAGGDVSIVSLLIRAGASVWSPQAESGKTALMLAAGSGRAEAVELLINGGANRLALDAEGRSALDLAEAGGHEKCVALLSAEPTAAEKEWGAVSDGQSSGTRRLNGALLEVNASLGDDPVALLVVRGIREETLPFELTEVSEGQATFRLLPSGKVQTVEAKGAVGDSNWYLSRIEAEAGKSPSWWRPQVTLRQSVSGRKVAVIPRLPARLGAMVVVIEFGPARDLYEACPTDKFTIKGASEKHYIVDTLDTRVVTIHEVDKPNERINLRVGGDR